MIKLTLQLLPFPHILDPFRGYIIDENFVSLPQQALITFLTRGGTSWASLGSCWHFRWHDPVKILWMHSHLVWFFCVQFPYHVKQIIIHCRYPLPLSLPIFYPFFYLLYYFCPTFSMMPNPWGNGCNWCTI